MFHRALLMLETAVWLFQPVIMGNLAFAPEPHMIVAQMVDMSPGPSVQPCRVRANLLSKNHFVTKQSPRSHQGPAQAEEYEPHVGALFFHVSCLQDHAAESSRAAFTLAILDRSKSSQTVTPAKPHTPCLFKNALFDRVDALS